MKLLDNIQQTLRFPSELVALEVCYTGSSSRYNAVQIRRVKDQLQVEGTASGENLKEVLETFNENLPVLLMLTGRRVLVKEIEGIEEEAKEERIMDRAFPNISLEELVYNIELIEGNAIVSVVRKDFLEQELENTAIGNRKVIDVYIGVHTLWPLLQQLDDDLRLGFHQLKLKQRVVELHDENNTGELEIMGEYLPANMVIPFIQGISSMASYSYVSQERQVIRTRKDWQFHNLYKRVMFSGLVGVFCILLISFLLFNYFHDANQALSENIQSYDEQLKIVGDLKDSYEQKNQFLMVNGMATSSFSFMADQVAATVPKGITLQKMSFFPLEKRLKKEKLVRFYRDQLVLKGEVDNYAYFQRWLDEMNAFKWTDDIQIAGYQEENNRHEATFNLKVLLQP